MSSDTTQPIRRKNKLRNFTIVEESTYYKVQINKIVLKLAAETTKILNEKQTELQNISWTNGESNLDTEYSQLACNCCKMAWEAIKTKYPKYSKTDITCEIPDINITFTHSDGNKSIHKIELKSSKSTKMPGGTINKLDVNQPLIYCKRPSIPSEPYKVRCSQYHAAMGESDIDLFQDRTPRPFINFEKMSEPDTNVPFVTKDKDDWIDHYAVCAYNRTKPTTKCKQSWQDDMIKKIKEKAIDDYLMNTSEVEILIRKRCLLLTNI